MSRHQIYEQWLSREGVTYEYRAKVPLSRIDIGRSLGNQARLQGKVVDEDLVETYAEAMREGAEFPAVIAWSDPEAKTDADLVLITGNHRHAAYLKLEVRETDCYLVKNTSPFVISRLTLTANQIEGKRPSREEQLAHARWLYHEGQQDVTAVARMVNLPRSTVDTAIRVERLQHELYAMGIDAAKLGTLATVRVGQFRENKPVFKAFASAVAEHKLNLEDVDALVGRVKAASTEAEKIGVVEAYVDQPVVRERAAITRGGTAGQRLTPAIQLKGHLARMNGHLRRFNNPKALQVRDEQQFDELYALWKESQSMMGQVLSMGRRQFGGAPTPIKGKKDGVEAVAATSGG